MADEHVREIATGSGTKVSKRKLKRLQVSRSSWFILLVKGMCLFFHPQRICVVRFHTKFTANPPLVTQFETATSKKVFLALQPWYSRVLRSTSYLRDAWDGFELQTLSLRAGTLLNHGCITSLSSFGMFFLDLLNISS